MPNVVQGNVDTQVSMPEGKRQQYPFGLDLHPDSDLSKNLVQKVMQRARIAHEHLSSRRESWREIDKTLTAYIPLDDAEKIIKKNNPKSPVSIVFPHSYSVLETLTSFMDGIFLKEPIFRYTGNSPEDEIGAILLEQVIATHCRRFKVGLSLHTAFKDGIAYGIGACFPMWKQKLGRRTTTSYSISGDLLKTVEPVVLFEGNALENVDPYQILLDPNYGIQSVQDSEFVGFVRRTNYYNLLTQDDEENVFNVEYLKHMSATSSLYEEGRMDKHTNVSSSSILKPVDVVYLYIKIIPKDWGLGDYEGPEKWMFAIAGDRVIIQARPLDVDHDLFPIALCAPTFDGYSSSPISRLELLSGMQNLLNWLFNSHITNVRKTLNDIIIYDPFVLNTEDIIDPKPGKLVRVRKAAWGKDIRGSIQQLNVNDVTRQNIGDAQVTMGLMNQISGSDDALMGTLRMGGPERLSAAEFQGTQNQAFGRLQSLAMIVGQQLMQDIGYIFAMHTKQFMTDELWVSTVGEWQTRLSEILGGKISSERMKVTPTDLNIDFDVVVNRPDSDNKTSAQFWVQMFDVIAKSPELYATIDIAKVFRYVAMQLGAQNVDEFLRVQPTMASDASVVQQAQAGNIVPVEGVIDALGR